MYAVASLRKNENVRARAHNCNVQSDTDYWKRSFLEQLHDKVSIKDGALKTTNQSYRAIE